jgi:two-component SAPR family response regulator
MQTEHQVTFDCYRLDLASEQLWCGSAEIPLPAKAFAMLRYLIEHAGQLVSKAEVFAALWPGIAVTDGALTFCIVELRKALCIGVGIASSVRSASSQVRPSRPRRRSIGRAWTGGGRSSANWRPS